MKMNLCNILCACALGIASTSASAAGFTAPVQVVGIDVGDTNRLILRLSTATECGTPWVIIGRDQPYYKEMFAMASMAHATGKTIQVWVASCNTAESAAVVVRMTIGRVW